MAELFFGVDQTKCVKLFYYKDNYSLGCGAVFVI